MNISCSYRISGVSNSRGNDLPHFVLSRLVYVFQLARHCKITTTPNATIKTKEKFFSLNDSNFFSSLHAPVSASNSFCIRRIMGSGDGEDQAMKLGFCF